jgi:spermidine/putrescine transport system permease protein
LECRYLAGFGPLGGYCGSDHGSGDCAGLSIGLFYRLEARAPAGDSPDLPLAKLASSLHLVEAGSALYPSAFAVYLGMLSAFLPFVVLPLYSSVERMDMSLLEAAQDLYASRFRVFIHAILPQTLPGLTVSVILTFVPAMGMFVVPDILGGGKFLMVGNLIQQQFGSSRDWPYGAALSLVLVLLTLVGLRFYRRYGKGVDLA